MRRTTILLTTAALLAGCGAEARTEPEAEAERREAALDYARCMREHGVDVPDPAPDESGRVVMGGPVSRAPVPPERFGAADEECRDELDGLQPPEVSPEQEREMREGALAHARCMREQGIDFPDPTFDDDGRAAVQIPRGAIDLDDERFRAAEEACRDELPEPRP